MSPRPGTPQTLDPETILTDPTDDRIWRHNGHWWSPLARRPYAAAAVLGAGMIALTVVVALVADLPLRDADGLLGRRAVLLVGTIVAFLTLEIVPRAVRRRTAEHGFWPAVRAVFAERWSRRRLAVAGIGLLCFYATYLSYRNLKSFLPFLVQQDQDRALLDLERGILGVDPTEFLQSILGTGVMAHVLSVVYLFFLAFVPISLGAALILSPNPVPGMWWVTALGFNWTLGVLSYYLLPSLGPAFVDPTLVSQLPDTGVTALQTTLVLQRQEVTIDPFSSSEVQSIAAFASLHASVVFSAALIGQLLKVPVVLRRALWIFLALTLLATVYFGWHYVVDDIAGLVIGGISVVLSAIATGHWSVLRQPRAT